MKTIIEMAREHQDHPDFGDLGHEVEFLERFAELVLAAERNHIAGAFEDNHEVVKHRNNYWLHAANYVRARGKEALAQPEQEPEFAYVMEAGEDRWKKLLIQERNFCQRCGKRLADLTAIHTCTPPAQA